jgi:hypothetical protein
MGREIAIAIFGAASFFILYYIVDGIQTLQHKVRTLEGVVGMLLMKTPGVEILGAPNDIEQK